MRKAILPIIILFFLIFCYMYFGIKAAPDKIGLIINEEKNINLIVPVKAEVSEGDISLSQSGFFPVLSFSSAKSCKALVLLKFCGIPVKSIDVAVIKNTSLVPSGQIVGLETADKKYLSGTITFYNKETNDFSALAHGLDGIEDNKELSGNIYYAETGNVVKGENGTMGALTGNIFTDRPCGIMKYNTKYGVYGKIFDNFVKSGHLPTEVALSDQVQLGDAEFISDVEGLGVKDYKCEVVGFENGYFIINITDDYLVEKTGGVVYGMSGTPVIQNNKIIGAITGGKLQDPKRIYCIYIQDVIADCEKYNIN